MLADQIQADLTAAMKARDELTLSVLRRMSSGDFSVRSSASSANASTSPMSSASTVAMPIASRLRGLTVDLGSRA